LQIVWQLEQPLTQCQTFDQFGIIPDVTRLREMWQSSSIQHGNVVFEYELPRSQHMENYGTMLPPYRPEEVQNHLIPKPDGVVQQECDQITMIFRRQGLGDYEIQPLPDSISPGASIFSCVAHQDEFCSSLLPSVQLSLNTPPPPSPFKRPVSSEFANA
jgi:hypothetical protein